MVKTNPWFAPLAWLYKMAISFRHRLFDWGILPTERFDIPIICIGNITVGGTGKTPMAEMVVGHLSQSFKVALISRGYGRKTKGYIEVKPDVHYIEVGDEPKMIKMKFPDVPVVVCEDRVAGIKRLRKEHPEVQVVVMDDGFQHRHVEPRINVLIIDSTRPFAEDDYLPAGTLRDKLSALDRAHYFIVTKCSPTMSQLDQRLWRKDLQKVAYQKIYFTRVIPSAPIALFPSDLSLNGGDEVVVMSGIGNPKPFVKSIREQYKVVATYNFPDHHIYSVDDLQRVAKSLEKHPAARLLTTEKDAVKLRRSRRVPDIIRQRLFYMPVVMEFLEGSDEDLLGTLKDDLDGKLHFGDLTIGGSKEQ